MIYRLAPNTGTFVGLVCILGYPLTAFGAVNLELRPATQTIQVGNTVNLGLYAVSTTGGPTPVGRIRAVLSWNPSRLDLLGINNNGPYTWLITGFPDDSSGDGINNSFDDGNAFYEALSQFSPLAQATPAGLLVTTFQFTALTTGSNTNVTIIPQLGSTVTEVLNALPPSGTNVTGTLGSATVTIICVSSANCSDQNPCTDDSCVSQQCQHVADDSNMPNDGLYCNGVEDFCQGGMVVYQIPPPDCDDGFSCTVDSCDEIQDMCVHTILANRCLIGGACYTVGSPNPANDCEVCNSSASQTEWSDRPTGAPCGSQANTDCDDPNTCNGSGVCLPNNAPDGLACTTDNNDCTQDVCSAGVCTHAPRPAGSACGSSANTTCTDPDTCNGSGACLGNHAADGVLCDDGLFCTTASSCQNGDCVGSGNACPPDQVCDEVHDQCKAVDLTWSPSQQIVILNGTVDIQLIATSGTGANMPFGAVGVILAWNPSQLELLGHFDDGPYLWTSSLFPADCGLDSLNAPCKGTLPQNDGNAYYEAVGDFAPSPPAVATPSGIQITTFRFRALATGIAMVDLVPKFGQFTTTRVLDAEVPGLSILGTLGSHASVEVLQCTLDAHCDDGQFCTGTETCANTQCVAGSYPCGAQLCDEETNQCVMCLNNNQCSDGVFCNGLEQCVGGSCTAGSYPCGGQLCDDELNACVNCLENLHCNDGLSCTMDICIAGNCFVQADDAPCQDTVFCNGLEYCDVEVGCLSSGNPCPDPATCEEASDTCGGCEAPTVVAEGSRYLRVIPPSGPDPVALFVYGDPRDGDVACVALYVQVDGTLAPHPIFRTPAAWGELYLRGLEVRPDTKYRVHTDCGIPTDPLLSAGEDARTWVFGDIDNSGGVDLGDLLQMIDAFSGNFGNLTLQNVDIMPCEPNGEVDLEDLLVMLSAFTGTEVACGRPCPAMTELGFIVAIILIATGGTLVFRRAACDRSAVDRPPGLSS